MNGVSRDDKPANEAPTVAIDGWFTDGDRRGIGKAALVLFEQLDRIAGGFKYEFLIPRPPSTSMRSLAPRAKWVSLGMWPYPVWEQVTVPRYLSRQRPAIFHAVANTGPLLIKAARTPMVLTVNDLLFMEARNLATFRQRAGAIYRRTVVPLAVRLADWIIAISESTKNQLVDMFPEAGRKISVIGLPISEEYFRAENKGAGHTAAPYLLAFGGTDPRKNVTRVVSAFLKARRVDPNLQLVLVGSQGMNLRLTDSQNGITALGYVQEAQLIELYRHARGLVYPSLGEGYGIPIVEAMAAGVPVVTSDRDPMRWLAGGAALLVSPEDTGSIAEAIVKLAKSQAIYRECSRAGRRRAQQFSPKSIASEIIEVYSRVAGSRSVRGVSVQ